MYNQWYIQLLCILCKPIHIKEAGSGFLKYLVYTKKCNIYIYIYMYYIIYICQYFAGYVFPLKANNISRMSFYISKLGDENEFCEWRLSIELIYGAPF